MADTPDAEQYVVETDEGEVNVLDHLTEVTVSAGRKRQLEQFEPIDERATATVSLPETLSAEERVRAVERLAQFVWDEAERGVATRFEQHVRKEAFGDD